MQETPNQRIACLVAAPPGLMRNALVAFLRSIPRLDIVALASDIAAVIQCVGERQTDVLVVDINLSESDVLKLVRQLAVEQTTLDSIVLVDTLRQQELSLGAGAHHALLKGFLDSRLREAVLSRSDDALRDMEQRDNDGSMARPSPANA